MKTDQEMVRWALEESSEPIIKNPYLRSMFAGGQLVQPGPGRPGYKGEPWLIKQKQQAKNIKNQKATWDKIGDAMWKANETGDFEYLMNSEKLQKDIKQYDPTRKKPIKYKKGMIDGSMRNVISGGTKHGKSVLPLAQNETALRYIASQYNMDVDRVLDILEEAKDFSSQSRQLTWREQILAKSSKTRSQFATGEKWMLNNAKRFDDPAKFKAAYIKRFGRGNAFMKAITNNTKAYFSSNFNFNLMGLKGLSDEGSKMSKKLGDNIFSSVIYNMNPKVRKSITNEFERALTGDVPTVKYQARKILTESPLLKKFGLDKRIHGPISRLIFKEIGDKMYQNLQAFRNPRVTTWDFLNYLEDVVDPQYKSQFIEARKAVDYAGRNKWKDAKKVLNIADNINWDHKIPSFLIDAGYADELEYIKLQPTTEHFNMKIKNKQFDIPMAKLIKEYENAPASQKGNVITKMQDKIDDFSRQHGGYMKGVKVTPDKTGKPIFTSQGDVLTKKTDVVKSLKTSLAQEKFPTMNNKQQMNFLKKMGYRCRRASGGEETVTCYMDDVKKTRNDLKSSNVEVRAKALTKQRKALQLASKLPGIGKILKTGIQMGTAAITKPLKVLGLTAPIGYAIEGIVEGGFYDNARRKGYSHKQAMAETFTPGLIAGRPHDVPWHGGSEKLREKELYGVREAPKILDDGTIVPGDLIPGKVQPKVKQYVDALKEQDRIYDVIGRKEELKGEPTTTDETLFIPGDLAGASADVQDLARSGAYRRVDQTLKPESMASQAYETAVEQQLGKDLQRKKEYLEEYDPGALEHEEKILSRPRQLEKRYEAMEEKFPTYTREQLDEMLETWGANSPWNLGFESGVKGYEQMGEWLKTHDKYKDMEAGVANRATGGIASLKK
jgi:hypothetical protein